MVDALVLGTSGAIRGGSSPLSRTKNPCFNTSIKAGILFTPAEFS